ncbi:MAG: hypothetical protein H0T11_05215, partial [Chthoniobacterales bacterium]|nr:hypothetical protein [Chthoniobacterales bacterium]
RIWGAEGTITLFKGEPPTNRLLVDQHQLRVRDTDGIVKGYPAEFINRPPNPQRPWDLGQLASGAQLHIVDYSTAVEGKLNPKPLESGGAPAVHFAIATAMMAQRLESWVLADDGEHSSFNMGLAAISLKRGTAPAGTPADAAAPEGEVEIEESIFAFTRSPEQQVGKVAKGGSSGAKVVLSQPEIGNKGTVTISVGDKSWTRDVAENIGRETPLEGSSFTMRVEGYWSDFRIDNGKPTSVSDQPNNPAVVVTLRGRGVPVAAPADAHGAPDPAQDAGAAGAPQNRLTLFIADDGRITYELVSRKAGRSTGALELNTPLPTGWADWQLTVDRTMPHAEHWMDFNPIASPAAGANLPDGIRVRVQQEGSTIEQWIPAGWQIALPTAPAPIQVAYGWKQEQLPIALELLDFEVQRNEGSDSPAGFKSTVRVTDRDGGSATGQCWMNNPFSYPGVWWRTWSGLTYKMSQASWNPENLGQSTIQILRDPGWLLKWIGSLLICTGIFMLFYLKGFRRPSAGSPTAAASAPPAEKRALAEVAS